MPRSTMHTPMSTIAFVTISLFKDNAGRPYLCLIKNIMPIVVLPRRCNRNAGLRNSSMMILCIRLEVTASKPKLLRLFTAYGTDDADAAESIALDLLFYGQPKD
ncbi:hypothetical protein CHS0354_026956 [Potamilus streckersoni]|uniref:Uncharacterized protein n=1 Tax=Potamilus streckersoni TaxID=2493646 RepID=A0AAE0SCG4_9BIVA|nr:hypothetical protein CHS0354_026956 [Potamilus streckersoni]